MAAAHRTSATFVSRLRAVCGPEDCDSKRPVSQTRPQVPFMKREPAWNVKFVTTLLEEISILRGELISQRKLLIELLSIVSKEPRRKIKERAYQNRLVGPFGIAKDVKKHLGLIEDKEQP